jgi:hypothetical protein
MINQFLSIRQAEFSISETMSRKIGLLFIKSPNDLVFCSWFDGKEILPQPIWRESENRNGLSTHG